MCEEIIITARDGIDEEAYAEEFYPECIIPEYILDDYDAFVENITSYKGDDDKNNLGRYLHEVKARMLENFKIFNGFPDQLACALMLVIVVDSSELDNYDLSEKPDWSDIHNNVKVLSEHLELFTKIKDNEEMRGQLVTAVLVLHFYQKTQQD